MQTLLAGLIVLNLCTYVSQSDKALRSTKPLLWDETPNILKIRGQERNDISFFYTEPLVPSKRHPTVSKAAGVSRRNSSLIELKRQKKEQGMKRMLLSAIKTIMKSVRSSKLFLLYHDANIKDVKPQSVLSSLTHTDKHLLVCIVSIFIYWIRICVSCNMYAFCLKSPINTRDILSCALLWLVSTEQYGTVQYGTVRVC